MNLPTPAQINNAWPFTAGVVDQAKLGPLVLDRDALARTTARTFDVGQRVLCPGTPGAYDPVYRAGGIGTVDSIIESTFGRPLVRVILDGASSTTPEPYRPDEIKPAPTL
jgi:hypothetical protein